MKIYNKDKTQELLHIDHTKGRLVQDKLFIRHIDKVEEQGHYETIKEYPNGGKDVKWIVDKEAVDEQDEYEDIMVFIPYTTTELAVIELQENKNWYNVYYTEHEQKYRRLQTLGKLTDEGTNPHEELIKLYEEAEIRRARIQELEKELDIVEEPSTLDS